jgi:glycosyltransferase involved in cell wall biosynthesis
MKVIHLPSTVGGNPQGISRHLRELGIDSKTWTLVQNYFAYPSDYVILNESDSIFKKDLKKSFALRYIFQFDIVFFNFGTGLYDPYYETINTANLAKHKKAYVVFYNYFNRFLGRVEVKLLKWLNKPIFIQYQGDDARQGDYCLQNFQITIANRVGPEYYNKDSDDLKRKRIKFYSSYAHKIYALNPDLLHVLPESASFLPYSHISLSDWSPQFTQKEDRPLRIGHAPSHRAAKGTDLVIDAIEKLKREGYNFELVLIEGLSNSDAKEIYKTIDVLIDQLFAGWYGGLAVEAMALGKPVIAYIRQNDLKFIPKQMSEDLPIVRAEPSTIYDVLKQILNLSRDQLLDKAMLSRQYVEKWHNPITIAKQLKHDMDIAIEKIR